MRKKRHLIIALLLTMTISVGAFAYTFTTSGTATVDVEAAGEIATAEEAAGQPSWYSLLPVPLPGTEILRPDAAGDVTDIAYQEPPSDGEHWDKVAEEAADDWNTYVYTDSKHYQVDLYNIADQAVGLGTIDSVTVYFRFAASDAGKKKDKARAKAVIKTYDTVYRGTEERVDDGEFVTRTYEWTTNPNTAEAWTWGEIDDLQAGVALRLIDKKGTASCTQVFVVVDYVEEPVTEGDVPIGDLFDIAVNEAYTGDVAVTIYLLNTGSLVKAYRYLNIMVELEGSVGGVYQLITLENGVANFTLENVAGLTRTLSVSGGSYALVSADASEWGSGWSITPEFYCEITQR